MAGERVFLITTRSVGEDERMVFLREAETRSLLDTLGLCVICSQSYTIKEENNVTYLGKGQAEAAAEYMRAFDAEEVVFDVFLSPRQEMKLEEIFQCPVSDREAVILSIFFQNAHSKEARLQIEKAQAKYMKPRLIFREANFSQQRGGVRGAKGEGEKALELQRRTIDQRIKVLEREIEEVKRIRLTQRKESERNQVFRFALTGYTNAGKSSILNRLTQSNVLSEDKLFATLDTTTRSLKLPSSQTVLLSDTVGFIQDLPHGLVEAFSSTLEEALNADAVIIVADASHPDSKGCFETTLATLSELGALDKVKLVVINKVDDIFDDISFHYLRSQPYRIVETSMKDGRGIEEMLQALAEITDEGWENITLLLPYGSPVLSDLSGRGYVSNIIYGESTIKVEARIPSILLGKYENWIE